MYRKVKGKNSLSLTELFNKAEELKKDRLLKKEKKKLYFEKNQINPRLPENAWIDTKGKIYPLVFGEHEQFASQWMEKNTVGFDLLFSNFLSFKGVYLSKFYQFLELIGWVKIHQNKIMACKVKYSNGKIYFTSCDYDLDLTDETNERILKLLKNKNYIIYEDKTK